MVIVTLNQINFSNKLQEIKWTTMVQAEHRNLQLFHGLHDRVYLIAEC